jgi:DNA sulfur modification protein DndB
MTASKARELVLPSLRGAMGDWIYYSAMMKASDLVERVNYAEEIHESQDLSDWIQRRLEGERAAKIAKYLQSTPQRFFNSLVIAVYDGAPRWIEIGEVSLAADPQVQEKIASNAAGLIGFLHLSGTEKMFAVDGQHRLAGFKKASSSGMELTKEVVSVLLVGHKDSAEGRIRTRRLFTTLNKTAVPVNKRDIIALDEDDVMAITARGLVENDDRFKDGRVALSVSQSIPATDTKCFTTIGALYDSLLQLFLARTGKKKDYLRFNRPDEQELSTRMAEATSFFDALGDAFPTLGKFFKATVPEKVAGPARTNGGHILFRPIGLVMITRLAVALSKDRGIELLDAVRVLKAIPTNLSEAPYTDVIWNPRSNVIVGKGTKLAFDLLRYMCDVPSDDQALLQRYKGALGNDAVLPKKIAALHRAIKKKPD